MIKKVWIVLLGLTLIAGCSSLKVRVDYDPEYDFVQQHAFSIVHHNKKGEDTLFNDRVIEALEQNLQEKAYKKTDKESADLIFVFHVGVESKKDIDTDYIRVGFGRYGYAGHMVATTRTYEYTKGTLIIDALNPKDEKIVWRGVTTDILKTHDTPQERTEYIQRVVDETMKEFPSKAEFE